MISYTYRAKTAHYLYLEKKSTAFQNCIAVSANDGESTVVYREAKIPSVGSRLTTSTYRFAKSSYRDSDGDLLTSDIVDVYSSLSTNGYVKYTLTSGTITTSYKTFSIGAKAYEEIYITAVYVGAGLDWECASSNDLYQVHTSYDDELSIDICGITYYFKIKAGSIMVKATTTVVLGENSTSANKYGAIVLSTAEA